MSSPQCPLLTYRYSRESETSSGEHYLGCKHALDSVLSTKGRDSRNRITLDLRGKEAAKRGKGEKNKRHVMGKEVTNAKEILHRFSDLSSSFFKQPL